jgi:hypothetical protein
MFFLKRQFRVARAYLAMRRGRAMMKLLDHLTFALNRHYARWTAPEDGIQLFLVFTERSESGDIKIGMSPLLAAMITDVVSDAQDQKKARLH